MLQKLFFLIVFSLVSCPLMAQSKLEVEFEFVRRMDLYKVGVEQKVKALEKLTVDYADDPGISDVQLKIASLLLINEPEHGFYPNPERAKYWRDKAAQIAVPGSDAWLQAKWSFAKQGPREKAIKIIDEIEAKSKGKSSTLANCEFARLELALDAGNVEEAEKRMRILGDWYSKTRSFSSSDEKSETDIVIQESVRRMLDYYSSAPISPVEKKEKIQKAADLVPSNIGILEHAKAATEKLDLEPAGRSIGRSIFIWGSILAMLSVVVFVVFKSGFQRISS